MAILLSAHEISKSFAARPLFEKLSFSLESGERVGLIGPNGAGKSTLLSILSGDRQPDSGTISQQRGLRISHLRQVPFFRAGATTRETVMEGASDPHDWEEIAEAGELLAKLELTDKADTLVHSLSGGWQKRAALARELLKKPDLLLLDEPTNHLDVESILWLEEFLARAPFATLTITHDRVFLQRVANRILELDRRNPGGILSVRGDYTRYLETKQNLIEGQAAREVRLRNTLRRETEWLRRGAKARTTKQEARIQRHAELAEAVEELGYRNAASAVRLDFTDPGRNPKKLIEAKNISRSYEDKTIIPKMDLLISPKTRLGLIGANGAGKSTLLRLLLRLEAPDTGSVTHADNLKISYFEQNRESLNPEQSVYKTLCPRGDHVEYAGSRVHVRSYLDRFLFSGNQVDMPVGRLSGGEQSRLLLARLMLEPANVLVMDEPTNDLDMSTLDVLQEVLGEFNGAVILVTHDRYFLDQTANQILGFHVQENGTREIASFANLPQWEYWHERLPSSENKASAPKEKQAKAAPDARTLPPKKKRLSFKEQRELDGMEAAISGKEARLKELASESEKPEVATHASRLLEITTEMSALQEEIERLYDRWSELEA